MSTTDGFEATFRIQLDRPTAWARVVGGEEAVAPGDQLWLPGFDSRATVQEIDEAQRLLARKDDEPCAGTDIVVTLEDEGTGTRVHVVQSGFGDWLPAMYDAMAIGWRHIVADLQTFLVTTVHARRHARPWGDLGATTTPTEGGLRLGAVAPGGLAERLGLADGDLLVALCDTPVVTREELETALRVIAATGARPTAEWVRADRLMAGPATPVA